VTFGAVCEFGAVCDCRVGAPQTRAVAGMGRSPHCVFCGLRAPGHHKLLEPGYVEALLEAQRAAEVECPISDVMRAQLAKSELAKSDDGEEEAPDAALCACMCCYYWIERRRDLPVPLLPMQNLLWFVRTLSWCEGACDSRVLLRLVTAVTEPDNVFGGAFAATELAGLRRIARAGRQRLARGAAGRAARVQGEARFCVKRAIARLWRDENADCLLLPHAAAAEWLRGAEAAGDGVV